jgi:spermidine synthase
LLQSWLARRWPARTVYRLFALSNAGSLAGLVAYPLLIEPNLGSRAQALGWSAAYAVFALACAGAAWRASTFALRATAHESAAAAGSASASIAAAGLPGEAPGAPGPGAKSGPWAWLGLSALGVVILLGATAHMSQNIASVPFLWLVPLILYLLSFVLAFEGRGGRGWYNPAWGIAAALAAAILMALGLQAAGGVLDISLAVPLYSAGVLLTCLFCHGELAGRRPGASDLTRFYLMISLGGALGGIFAGLVAPRVFAGVYEFPLALCAVCVAAALAAWNQPALGPMRGWLLSAAAAAALATAVCDVRFVRFLQSDVILMQRNFYGTLRVRQVGVGVQQMRRLMHGVILHGEQPTQAPDRLEPGSYYARTSGVGLAIEAAQQRSPAIRLGVIGLGAGTLSAYGRAGDTVRFYEIDPDVVAIARGQFTYLGSTPATVQIALGDARLSLQREVEAGQAPRFDVLAVDAFSSDSIPVHLLTRQALQLYGRCMADGGIVAVHISNRFLDLKPVLANLAADLRLSAQLVSDDPDEHSRASRSDWVLLSARPDAYAQAPFAGRVTGLEPDPGVGLWTDQFNNLLGILKSRPLKALRALW